MKDEAPLPKVSIVIVNLNGKHHLKECFNSILALHYPKEKIEIVLVDNASIDGSAEFVKQKYPMVRLLRNERNEGFAKPSNDGARAATGEYVAFLNNDMRVQRDWLIELVQSLQRGNADCAGSVILNWSGAALDFAGGSVTFYGAGFQYDVKKPIKQLENSLRQDKEILFACGGAMLMKRDVFLFAGGFDEDYFAYYEDIDLGWRLNVLGYKVVLSVRSRVYHKHNSTGSKLGNSRLFYLFHRNSLCTLYKNFGDGMLGKSFWPTVLMNSALIFRSSGLTEDSYEYGSAMHGHAEKEGITISSDAAANLCAQSQFVGMLNVMSAKREFIQKNRKVADEALMRFFPDPFLCAGPDIRIYSNVKFDIAKSFGLDQAFHTPLKRRVLLITGDRIGRKMAGPAIRYTEMAGALSKYFDVVLAAIGEEPYPFESFRTVVYTMADMTNLLEEAVRADIVMLQGFTMEFSRPLENILKTKYTIFDLYDPIVIESMDSMKGQSMDVRVSTYRSSSVAVERQLRMGDFFAAANEKQVDYWMGMLTAVGRVSPKSYDQSSNMERLIGIVPFGISDTDPVHSRAVLKGVWPGIEKDDFLLIWGGGVWNWFDPLTLIKAVDRVAKAHPRVKLFFMGVKSPNPDVPEMQMLTDAVNLAKKLGIYDKHVFFNFSWVDYADRQNYLVEADVGVSFHFDTLETRFSFRTRILDYLWAHLPIICTRGDYFADLIAQRNMGITVDYQNAEQLADAIVALMEDKPRYEMCRAHVAEVAEGYRWSRVCKPLIDFCKNPVHMRRVPYTWQERGVESASQGFAGKKAEMSEEYGESHELSEEMAEADTLSVPLRHSSSGRHGGVLQQLDRIEQRQVGMERNLHVNTRRAKKLNAEISELLVWSYMMNDRFNKVKKLANPLRMFRRLFRRK